MALALIAAPASSLTRLQHVLLAGLTLLSLSQMFGYLVDSTTLRGLGAASLVAPFPKVFSDVSGLETFASEFTLQLSYSDGSTVNAPITPELYNRLPGPYNRRNVYGAALSYAPRLPPELVEAVLRFAVSPNPAGNLLSELGLRADPICTRLEIRTKTIGRSDRWVIDGPCNLVTPPEPQGAQSQGAQSQGVQ